MKQTVNSRSVTAWVLAAVSGPLAFVAGKSSLTETVVATGVCTLLTVLGQKLQNKSASKWMAVVQYAFLAIVIAKVLRMSADAWPDSGRNMFVPLVLLALAAVGAGKGIEAASAVGAMLMWLLALLFGVIVAGGIGSVKLERIELWSNPSKGDIFLVGLLPGVMFFLPGEEKEGKWLWWLPLLGCVVSMLVTGTLSAAVARQQENPFYEYGKSLRLVGMVERYEAFVSVALTLSYYCLLSLLLSASDNVGKAAFQTKGTLFLTAMAGLVLMNLEFKAAYPLAVIALIMWYAAPVIMHKNKDLK